VGSTSHLSGRPDEHQLAIASLPEDATFSTINQVSFRVGSLDDLKRYHGWLKDERVKDLETRDHGNAWSIYFSDPEGNRMEIYCPTPWYVSQPFGEPLDLTAPSETILAKTEAMVRQDPTSRPAEVCRRYAPTARSRSRRPERYSAARLLARGAVIRDIVRVKPRVADQPFVVF
jgi:hypothetical protein